MWGVCRGPTVIIGWWVPQLRVGREHFSFVGTPVSLFKMKMGKIFPTKFLIFLC